MTVHATIQSLKCVVATKYKVSVFTGDKPDAGTDANVYINLIGEHGESGKRPLDNKLKDDFQRGKYVFHIFVHKIYISLLKAIFNLLHYSFYVIKIQGITYNYLSFILLIT